MTPTPTPAPPPPWRGPMPIPKEGLPPPPVPARWRRILGPVYRAWMKLAHVLAWINTRILLGVIYFVFLMPIRGVMRLFGRDPLTRRPDPKRATYWVERSPEERQRPPEDYQNQY